MPDGDSSHDLPITPPPATDPGADPGPDPAAVPDDDPADLPDEAEELGDFA